MIEVLKEIIVNSLKKMNINMNINDINIEIPKDNKNGDYSSTIALQLSKELKKNPLNIAEEIVSNITDDRINKLEIAKPGFINFYLKKDYLFDNLNKIIIEDSDYGRLNIGKNKKINIEFVSANPTGTLHIGHGRGAVYGSSLASILTFAGYDVTKEYYINDAGNQINNLNKSIKIRYNNLCGKDEELDKDCYHGKEIIALAKDIYEKYQNKATDEIIRDYGIDYLLSEIRKDLKDFRIEFDIWSSEKTIYEKGLVDKTLNRLIDSGYTYNSENALWLKTTEFGDDKDRVLVKSDGDSTYLLPDIAYHIEKYNRGYDNLIDVLGADHHGYINRLKASLKILGENPEKLTIKILQMVRLIKNKEEVKLSKRTGKTYTLRELMDEVGTDAARFFFVNKSLDTQLDFDLDLAISNSNENPVYYIQYAYARISSILKDYNKDIVTLEKYVTIDSECAYNLMAKLYEFPNIIKLASEKYAPHILTNYVYDVASLFHSFYNSEKVLTSDINKTTERINLIKATAVVIKNSLDLILVEPKEKM